MASTRRLFQAAAELGLQEVVPHFQYASKDEIERVLKEYVARGEHHALLNLKMPLDPHQLPSFDYKQRSMSKIDIDKYVGSYEDTLSLQERFAVHSVGEYAFDEPPVSENAFIAARLLQSMFARWVLENQKDIALHLEDEDESMALFIMMQGCRRVSDSHLMFEIAFNFASSSQTDVGDVCMFIVDEMRNGRSIIKTIVTRDLLHLMHVLLCLRRDMLSKEYRMEHQRQWQPRDHLVHCSYLLPFQLLEFHEEFEFIKEMCLQVAPRGIFCDPEDKRQCDECKCHVVSRSCLCKQAFYCTRQCQSKAWLNAHHSDCSQRHLMVPGKSQPAEPVHTEASSSRTSSMNFDQRKMKSVDAQPTRKCVRIPACVPNEMVGLNGGVTGLFSIQRGKIGQNTKMFNTGEVQQIYPDGEIFLVKVQVPLMGGGRLPLLVYDRQRSFSTHVNEPKAIQVLAEAVQSVREWNGIKAFFEAAFKNGEIEVYLPPFANQRQTW